MATHIKRTHLALRSDPEPAYFQSLFSEHRGGYVRILPPPQKQPPPPTGQSMADLWDDQAQHDERLLDPPILQADDPRASHPFLLASGWGEPFKGKSYSYLEAMHATTKPSEMLTDTMALYVRRVRRLCNSGSYDARCLVNTERIGDPISHTAFAEVLQDATFDRYGRTWTNFLAFLIAHLDGDHDARWFDFPAALIEHTTALRESLHNASSPSDSVAYVQLLSYALLTTPATPTSPKPSPLKAFCILSNCPNTGIIADPVDVSPFLTGVQHMMRAVILCRASIQVALSADQTEPISLYAAVDVERQWITEQGSTAFSWLRRMVHLSASLALSSNQMPSFIWSRDNGQSFMYGGRRITLDELKALMQGSVKDVQIALDEVFDELGIPSKFRITRTNMGDNPSERATNFGFARHGTNAPERATAAEALRIVLNSGKFGRAHDGNLFWYRGPIEYALSICERFLRLLGCAMYLTGGQPPRGTELMAAQIINTSQRIRNIFCINEYIVSVIFVNKTSYSGHGDRAVARAYPLEITQAIIDYLMTIRPVERTFIYQLALEKRRMLAYSTYLFCMRKRIMTTEDLNIGFRALVPKHLSQCPDGLTISDLRQIAVYTGQKYVAPRFTEDRVAILDIQAGHHTDVAKRWYGTEESMLSGNMTDTQLDAFTEVSFAHWLVFGLVKDDKPPNAGNFTAVKLPQNSLNVPSSLPPPTPQDPISNSALMQTLLELKTDIAKVSDRDTTPPSAFVPSRLPIVSPDLLVALQQQLKVPNARFRSLEQAEAVTVAAERRNHLLAVLPTGCGKTEVFLLNAALERTLGLTTVVMVPLTTIQQQHVAAATARGLVAHQWPSDSIGDLLVCLFEVAGSSVFIKSMNELQRKGKLARIVVDEVHYLFAAASGFRVTMAAMTNLATIGAPLVLLTGTLPPCKVPVQLQMVGLSHAIQVRAPTTRKNLRYKVFKAGDPAQTKKDGTKTAEVEAAQAADALQKYFESLDPPVTNFIPKTTHPKDRTCVVIFSQWTELIDCLHKLKPNWLPVHAKLTREERHQNLLCWGTTHQVVIASSLLGLGYHRLGIRGSVHWEVPRNLLDFAQESGRVARDGRPGFATILWTRKPNMPSDDPWGRGVLIDALGSAECRRYRMDLFLDGRGTTCLTMIDDTTLCDNCTDALEAARARASKPTAIVQTPLELHKPQKSKPTRTALGLKHLMESLEGRCAACFVFGNMPKTHKHVCCPSATEHYATDADDLKRDFRTFKGKFKIQPKRNLCYRCHLPQTLEWHAKERGGSSECQFKDTCTAVLYHALRWPITRQVLIDRYQMPEDEIDSSFPDWGCLISNDYLNEAKAFEFITNWILTKDE